MSKKSATIGAPPAQMVGLSGKKKVDRSHSNKLKKSPGNRKKRS